jgi:hypothetical protein
VLSIHELMCKCINAPMFLSRDDMNPGPTALRRVWAIRGACLISLCAGIWVWDWCKLGARKHAGR